MSQTDGIYACLKPDDNSKKIIKDIIKTLKLENSVREDDLHCTVIYSETYTYEMTYTEIVEAFYSIDLPITDVKIVGFSLFDTNNGSKCLVLNIESFDVEVIHKLSNAFFGTTYPHEKYIPHITLCYDYIGKLLSLDDISGCIVEITFDSSKMEKLQK